jgi:hypothetical protein
VSWFHVALVCFWDCRIYVTRIKVHLGRAIAQAVRRWLPTAAARVRTRVRSCGICGGQSGAGAGFLRVLRFPLSIFIPPIAPQSPSSIIWGLYNRPEVAAVPRDLVPPHKNKKKVHLATSRFNAQSSNSWIANYGPRAGCDTRELFVWAAGILWKIIFKIGPILSFFLISEAV